MFFRLTRLQISLPAFKRQFASHSFKIQSRFFSEEKKNQVDIIKDFIKMAQSGDKMKYPEEKLPEGYEDPHSVSKNPIFITVPTGSASPDQEQYAGINNDNIVIPEPTPGLVQDSEDTSIFYNKDSQIIGDIDPRIVMAMKCDICDTQLVKSMSKRSYTHGVVIVRCEGCKNLHLIADNLGWLDEKSVNIEQLMQEKGEDVLRTSTEDPSNLTPEQIKHIEEVTRKAGKKDLDASIHGVVNKNK